MGSRLARIGPYRIEDRLGAGGMGEVYRAWDERLERWVALKLIRPEAAESDKARERFRREARAAAGLSHPSLVQIHDILVEEAGDAIVMELVEGESLGRRLARGPLSARETLRLGREIAEGLAAAHAKGLIHRDLKSDNVMVTADGRAKILDFGLAKRLEGEAGLTRDSIVVGTFRSMSPEQARGLPLDHRSDLFSLGTLLYEMLTGRSPFEGDSTLDTLTRICTARQAPLWDAVSGIPPALSELVDRLLEKDPVFRPQSAREVAAILESLAGSSSSAVALGDDQATWVDRPGTAPSVRPFTAKSVASPVPSGGARKASRKRWVVLAAALAMAAAGLAVFLLRLPPGDPVSVAVLKPEVVAGPETDRADLLASGLRVALLRGLTSLEGISPLAPEQVDPVSGSAVEVAKAAAADEALTSRLECGAQVCQVSLSRVSGKDGSVLWAQSIEAPLDRPYLLAEAAEGHLRRGYGDHRLRRGAAGLDVRPEDYEEYLRLRGAFESRQEEELPAEALARLASLRASSPRFLEAFIFEAEALQHRFQFRRDPEDLKRASDLLARARELAPADPRPLFTLFEVAVKQQRLDEAEEVVHSLDRLQPGDSGVMVLRARMLELQGKPEEARALMREVVRRAPSWRNFYRAATLERRQGHDEEARRYLEQLLKRFPGYAMGESLLGEMELLTGSPQRAVELYTRLVERSPQPADLVNLGLAYMLLARYPEAEERFRQAYELSPGNPFFALNYADICYLRGKTARAEELYHKVIELIDADPAASQWQFLTTRAQALAHLNRRAEAVEAAQQVLRLAPDNPQAAYEVSLVYALVGDEASALVNAKRARALGVEPRWFTFPWFDPLRSLPEFQALARPASAPPSTPSL